MSEPIVCPLDYHNCAEDECDEGRCAVPAFRRAYGRGYIEGFRRTQRTWRHADGTVRIDHMDVRAGDYFGLPLEEQ